MKIAHISDIHFDMVSAIDCGFFYETTYDVLVLNGDLGNYHHAIDLIRELSGDMPDVDIIFVPGNHEYCGTIATFDEINKTFDEELDSLPNVHVLREGKSVDINGVVFIGATLWSDLGESEAPFSVQVACEIASKTMAWDFESINGGLEVSEFKQMHRTDKEGLKKSLEENQDKDVVVVTHFSPSILHRNESYPIDPVSYYFSGGSIDLLRQYQPNVWIYGHTHGDNEVTHYGDTEIRCNQTSSRTLFYRLSVFEL